LTFLKLTHKILIIIKFYLWNYKVNIDNNNNNNNKTNIKIDKVK